MTLTICTTAFLMAMRAAWPIGVRSKELAPKLKPLCDRLPAIAVSEIL